MASKPLSVRRLAKVSERLHHKQERYFKGKKFRISKILTQSQLASARRSGFTEVKRGKVWFPIRDFVVRPRGGNNMTKSFSSRGCKTVKTVKKKSKCLVIVKHYKKSFAGLDFNRNLYIGMYVQVLIDM